jgi:hypothetical protein
MLILSIWKWAERWKAQIQNISNNKLTLKGGIKHHSHKLLQLRQI